MISCLKKTTASLKICSTSSSQTPPLNKNKTKTVPLQLPRELLPPLPRAPLPPLRGPQGLLRHQREPGQGPRGPRRAADAPEGRRPRRAPGRRPARDRGRGLLAEAPAAVEAPDRVRGRDGGGVCWSSRRGGKDRCRCSSSSGSSGLSAAADAACAKGQGSASSSGPCSSPLCLPRRPDRRRRGLDWRARVGDPFVDARGPGRRQLFFL